MRILGAIVASALLCLPGCLAAQVARDGRSTQEAIADVYTQQALSNLIRAKNNLPFVQFAYTVLTVSDQDHYLGTLGLKQTVTTKRNLIAPLTRSLDNLTSLAGSADRTRNFTSNAEPITNQNDIYQRYLAFARDPHLFVVSDQPPGGPVHILRKCDHKYYWVPCEAGPAFLDLVLYVSQFRSRETTTAAPTPYEAKIVQVLNYQLVPGRDIANATLVFDKPIPNGEATMIVDLEGGRKVQMSLWPVSKDGAKAVKLGEPTTTLDAQWAPRKDGVTADQLPRRTARIYSHDYPQEAPAPNPVLGQIANDINLIRMNLLLNNNPR